jgi:hypothetical protein
MIGSIVEKYKSSVCYGGKGGSSGSARQSSTGSGNGRESAAETRAKAAAAERQSYWHNVAEKAYQYTKVATCATLGAEAGVVAGAGTLALTKNATTGTRVGIAAGAVSYEGCMNFL